MSVVNYARAVAKCLLKIMPELWQDVCCNLCHSCGKMYNVQGCGKMSVVNYASIKMYKKVGVNYARSVERNTRELCF